MLNSIRATGGMAVAPHALAAQSALAVLRERGNALEAMIAAAATIPVVYPHMNSIGGDGFWLIACARPAGARDRRLRRRGARGVARVVRGARTRQVDSVPRRRGRQHGRGHDLRAGSSRSRSAVNWAAGCRLRACLPMRSTTPSAASRSRRSQAANTAAKRARAGTAAGLRRDVSARWQRAGGGTGFQAAALGRDAAAAGRQGARRLLSGRARARDRGATWPTPAAR